MKIDLLSKPHGISGLALFTYIIWVIATFLLEGWMQTLMRPEAVIDRITYTSTCKPHLSNTNHCIGLEKS
jgi:hypothetical protein